MVHPVPVVPGIRTDDRILRDRIRYVGHEALGEHRHLIRAHGRIAEQFSGGLQIDECLTADRDLRGIDPALEAIRECGDCKRGIAGQRYLRRDRPRRVPGLNVDLEDALAVRVDQLRVFIAGLLRLQSAADHEHHIRRAEGVVGDRHSGIANSARGEVMCLRDGALAEITCDNRRTQKLG